MYMDCGLIEKKIVNIYQQSFTVSIYLSCTSSETKRLLGWKVLNSDGGVKEFRRYLQPFVHNTSEWLTDGWKEVTYQYLCTNRCLLLSLYFTDVSTTYRRLSMFSSCWTVSLPGLRSGSKPCLRGATPSVDCGAFRVRPLALSCCPLTSSSWRCILIYIHTYVHTSGLLLLGIAHTKPCIKFEVSSSSSNTVA